MCTPQMLQENCACAHGTGRGGVRFAALAVVAGCLVWVVAAGYGWVLALAGWLMLMGAAALVSENRRRRSGAPARPAVTLTARDYVRSPGER